MAYFTNMMTTIDNTMIQKMQNNRLHFFCFLYNLPTLMQLSYD